MGKLLPGGRGTNKGPDAAVNNQQWLDSRKLLSALSDHGTSICPRGTVLFMYVSEADERYFEDTGAAVRGTGPFAGWVICNGGMGTPDVSTALGAIGTALEAVRVFPFMKVF